MPRTITRTRRLTMEVEDCCVCGVLFAVERSYLDERRIDLATFYCPNGHGMTYTEDEIDLLRAQLTAKSDQLAAANRRVASLKDKMRREHVRVGNGVCPCSIPTIEKREYDGLIRWYLQYDSRCRRQ